jgi:hypothetical protein
LKGVLFISLFLPILNGIIFLFSQLIEYFCTLITVQTAKIQKEIPEEEELNTNVIGFQAPDIEENYDDEDED